ncbi:MAG: hypothetical protein E7Z88_07460 [Cyanobacteria bacterium SIG27]|nr:hypothetical protein [Cyanobacteria bacterium SIG27]
MMTYVSAFIFYTLAMIGVLLVGFIIYKKTFNQNTGLSKGMIKIVDSAPLGNKKMLHIVKIKNESFLIASGLEHTTFLAKLENNETISKSNEEKVIQKVFTPEVVEIPSFEEVKSQINEVPVQKVAPQKVAAQNISPKREVRYDDPEKYRAAELQRQFKELYEKEEVSPRVAPQPKIDVQALKRKENLKNLLREFHADMNVKSKGRI